MKQADQTIIFLHIPKTAGSTFKSIIKKNYKKKEIYELYSPNTKASLEKLKIMSDDEKRKIKIICGHVGYGIHRYLPQRCLYVTFLRDPVQRIVSHYYFVLAKPHHRLHQEIVSKRMSLKDHVSRPITNAVLNDQTRHIGANYPWIPRNKLEDTTRTMLNKAKKRCNHFSVIGLTERFDETLLLLKKEFAWKNIFYLRENVSKKPKQKLHEDFLRECKIKNQLDMELYDFAKRRFAKTLDEQGFKFAIELAIFKFLNGIYAKGGFLLIRFPGWLIRKLRFSKSN
jgi:hypothetical protein